MQKKMTLSVIGGDTRQVYAADALKALGYETALCGFTYFDAFPLRHPQLSPAQALAADVLLLPLPYTRNGKELFAPFSDAPLSLSAVQEAFDGGRRVFLGNADERAVRQYALRGAEVYDYYTDEALALYNARLTAEALLGIVIGALPVTLLGAETAVTGYGRIAFYTAGFLTACGAKTTVFARSPLQLAKAAAAGLQALPLSRFAAEERRFACVINTVPAQVLKRPALDRLNRDCLLVEAAGAPYGIDADAAGELGFRLIKAASLPGRVSPKSAGEAIARTVDERIRR